MIDFSSPSVFKLNPCDPATVYPQVAPLLIAQEQLMAAFRTTRDGSFDRDAELDLWFSGLGKVRLEFKADTDIRQLAQLIAAYVL